MSAIDQDQAQRGEIEIPYALEESIDSWRRIVGQATAENARTVLRNAASDLWRSEIVVKTMHPRTDGAVHRAIADALHDMAAEAGIDEDEAQSIIAGDATADEPREEFVPPLDMDSASGVRAWWCDPINIPPRKFLFGRHYIRGAVGATIAAGGRGKTTLGLFEAVCMSIGRDLRNGQDLAGGPLRVWVLNGEEDQDEIDRRLAATCQRYHVTHAELGGRLFAQSVREQLMHLATMVNGVATLNRQLIDQFIDFITQHKIDVLMIDPLVSFHSVPENDNGAMDLVIKRAFGAIASATDAAVEVFHHPGKPKPGQADSSVEDGRGASAILWAVRSARVLNFMTTEEAAKLGIGEDERRQHVRIADGKANLAPLGKAAWMKLVPENLSNGDQVACSAPWSPPDPFDGISTADMELARELARTGGYRRDARSPHWFGYAIAGHLNIDVAHGADNDPKHIARLKSIIDTWLKNNVIRVEKRKDAEHKSRDFVVPGSFVSAPSMPAHDEDDYVLQ